MIRKKERQFKFILTIVILLLPAIICPASKLPKLSGYIVLKDSALALGVDYKNVLIGKGRYKNSVHIIEADLRNPFISTAVLKAFGQANELEKLHDMIRKYDSLNPEKIVLGAVNANFWRAYTNRPIGPTIIDGELVEMITHKKWTSGFFNELSFLFIDTFFIHGTIRMKSGDILNIDKVNRRQDSIGIVVYNRFGGDTIPYIQTSIMAKAFTTALKDTTTEDDSTEVEMDTAGLYEQIRIEQMENNHEFNLKKVMVTYLDIPAVNKNIRCVVEKISDSGSVSMPKNGAVISFGDEYSISSLPRINDTLVIRFATNIYDSVVFYNSVCGTPRLVRNGVAKHEAREEGSKGRRFINRALPRTAIGTNKARTKIYFVSIEPDAKWKRVKGVNLTQLSAIMKQIGCFNAMNLDGGGSSMMIIDNKNVVRANPKTSRRISIGLAIVQKKKK